MTEGTGGRRRLVVGVVVGATLAGALALGLVVGTSTPGHAASRPSYCAASLAVDHYLGHDVGTVHALLGRVLAVAPPEVGGLVRTMRASAPRSARYAAASARWSQFNTDHCCACIGGTSVPHLLVAPDPGPRT